MKQKIKVPVEDPKETKEKKEKKIEDEKEPELVCIEIFFYFILYIFMDMYWSFIV